jgi:hypothetical protein
MIVIEEIEELAKKAMNDGDFLLASYLYTFIATRQGFSLYESELVNLTSDFSKKMVKEIEQRLGGLAISKN